MDLTQDTFKEKNERAKKMMLWFGIISMGMMFAGLTSAYVVSKSRPDWISDFELPIAFYWSTLVIVLSSFTFIFAKKNIKEGKRSVATAALIATLVLGIVFIFLQFESFAQIIESGYFFTGSESTVTTSFLYIIVLSHLIHIAAGLIVLLVVIYNHFKQRYHSGQMLGIELGATFWHFVDVLWIYLFLFLYFVR
ncbi:MAG TPA: cytochrome c oxidase subunit 3 [Salinimicrobium sp.]|nr:cytochrome c oxidase subunit 3 [Salinimicrobium sp.]